MLCNVATAAATTYAHANADLYLNPAAPLGNGNPASDTLTATDVDRIVGLYRNTNGHAAIIEGNTTEVRMRLNGFAIPLVARSPLRFSTNGGAVLTFDGRGGAIASDEDGLMNDRLARVPMANPSPTTLLAFVGYLYQR